MRTHRPYEFVPVDVPTTRRAQLSAWWARQQAVKRVGVKILTWAVIIYLLMSGWLLTVGIGILIMCMLGFRFGWRYNRYGTWVHDRSRRRR
jgi:hypothetical protein